MSAQVCILRRRTHSINVCVCELVFDTLHAIDTFTNRKSVNKQRVKACQQDINQILLDLDSLGFESFRFGILNCPSLVIPEPVSLSMGGCVAGIAWLLPQHYCKLCGGYFAVNGILP